MVSSYYRQATLGTNGLNLIQVILSKRNLYIQNSFLENLLLNLQYIVDTQAIIIFSGWFGLVFSQRSSLLSA